MNASNDPLVRKIWKVSVSRKLAVNPEQIWKMISKPGILHHYHPFCKRNEVHNWSGIGSVDEIFYENGLVFRRHFTNWLDGQGYDLEIGPENGKRSFVSWRIGKADNGTGILNITIYPNILQSYPAILRFIPHKVYIKPMLSKYLNSVLKGFEQYLLSEKPVRKNQFGTHSWFSKE